MAQTAQKTRRQQGKAQVKSLSRLDPRFRKDAIKRANKLKDALAKRMAGPRPNQTDIAIIDGINAQPGLTAKEYAIILGHHPNAINDTIYSTQEGLKLAMDGKIVISRHGRLPKWVDKIPPEHQKKLSDRVPENPLAVASLEGDFSPVVRHDYEETAKRAADILFNATVSPRKIKRTLEEVTSAAVTQAVRSEVNIKEAATLREQNDAFKNVIANNTATMRQLMIEFGIKPSDPSAETA